MRVSLKGAISRGVRGHAPPRKFYKIWIARDYISRVFIVEKVRKKKKSTVVKRRSKSPPLDLLKIHRQSSK